MRIALPLMAVLVGVAAFWLIRADERPVDDLGGPEGHAPEDHGPGGLLQGRGADPADRADGSSGAPRSNIPRLDPRTAARGNLTVLPVDEDDNVIPSKRVKVKVMSDGRRWPSQPVGHPDPNTNEWKFRKLFLGPVRILCRGYTFQDTVAKAKVTAREQDPIRVVVKSGGAIHWHITYDNGALPKKLKLELSRNGRPHTAWFQERHLRALSARMRTSSIELGHQGYITGLKAGTYLLRATNAEGYYRDVDVDVVLGQVAEASLKVRDVQGVEPPKPPAKEPEPREPENPTHLERNPVLDK